MKVGPESAGADPGPACYGKGGTRPTVSDANAVLGRLSPDGLLGGTMALDIDAARDAIAPAARQLNMSIEPTAHGIVSIVVSNMVRAIRAVSVERGHDPRNFALMPFGGAGPLHATDVARAIGIRDVIVPRDPGILCAQGLIVADRKEEFVRSKRLLLDNASMETLRQLTDTLGRDADAWFREEAPFDGAQRRLTTIVYDMRYVGQNFELSVLDTEQPAQTPDADRLKRLFFAAHEASYGFHNPDDAVEIINIRLTASVTAGSHLPDINMAMPVFVDGRLLAFICNVAHHADMGGMAPGSIAGGMSEIYQEGLRIPVVRLFDAGDLCRDIFDLLLLNARLPDERRGDYNAQIAACRLGARRLGELVERYSVDTLHGAFDELIARTTRRLRDAVAGIPDGAYEFADVMDDDGMGATDIPVVLRIDVSGDRIVFDFTGTAKQVSGNINVPLNPTHATVCYALKSLLDPTVPNNQGVIDVCEIVAEPGSLVNCVAPAPVAGRANTCQRIADMIIGALAEVLPTAVTGASNGANTTAVFSGLDPHTGQGYLYLETLGGGGGARHDHDGKDGVQVHTTNTSNLPVEAIEMEYPLRVERYELVEDSAGPGASRGGLGLRRVVTPVGHRCLFNGQGERFRHQAWGIFGGCAGRAGQFVFQAADGNETILDIKPSGVSVEPGEKIVIETPGAGGYGPPDDREENLLADDRESGKFTAAYLSEFYRR